MKDNLRLSCSDELNAPIDVEQVFLTLLKADNLDELIAYFSAKDNSENNSFLSDIIKLSYSLPAEEEKKKAFDWLVNKYTSEEIITAILNLPLLPKFKYPSCPEEFFDMIIPAYQSKYEIYAWLVEYGYLSPTISQKLTYTRALLGFQLDGEFPETVYNPTKHKDGTYRISVVGDRYVINTSILFSVLEEEEGNPVLSQEDKFLVEEITEQANKALQRILIHMLKEKFEVNIENISSKNTIAVILPKKIRLDRADEELLSRDGFSVISSSKENKLIISNKKKFFSKFTRSFSYGLYKNILNPLSYQPGESFILKINRELRQKDARLSQWYVNTKCQACINIDGYLFGEVIKALESVGAKPITAVNSNTIKVYNLTKIGLDPLISAMYSIDLEVVQAKDEAAKKNADSNSNKAKSPTEANSSTYFELLNGEERHFQKTKSANREKQAQEPKWKNPKEERNEFHLHNYPYWGFLNEKEKKKLAKCKKEATLSLPWEQIIAETQFEEPVREEDRSNFSAPILDIGKREKPKEDTRMNGRLLSDPLNVASTSESKEAKILPRKNSKKKKAIPLLSLGAPRRNF